MIKLQGFIFDPKLITAVRVNSSERNRDNEFTACIVIWYNGEDSVYSLSYPLLQPTYSRKHWYSLIPTLDKLTLDKVLKNPNADQINVALYKSHVKVLEDALLEGVENDNNDQ